MQTTASSGNNFFLHEGQNLGRKKSKNELNKMELTNFKLICPVS